MELRNTIEMPEWTDASPSRTASYRATSWGRCWQILIAQLDRLTYTCEWTQGEGSWSAIEGSLLWGLYRTAPTLIVYKTSYPHAFVQKVRSDTKKRKKWLSTFRPGRAKSQLLHFASEHRRKLTQPASICWAHTVQVWGRSAQWLWRTTRKAHGEKVPHGELWGTPKPTFAFAIGTRPNSNTICGHMQGV